VIVTSYLFPGGVFSEERLKSLAEKVGKDKLVVDIRWVSAVYPHIDQESLDKTS
jgi:hypothetical protein